MYNINQIFEKSEKDFKCFIIAEIGANHNRSLAKAKEMIDAAKECAADAVKFQIYTAEGLYSKKTPRHSGYDRDLFDLIKEIETPREWLGELRNYCAQKDIVFFATPFDKEAVDELDAVSGLFKIASFELVDIPLIEYAASKNKPMIISAGLASMGEMEDAYLACKRAQNDKIAFLQCASMYPAPASIMNLRAMNTIAQAFGVPTGLSDHTRGTHISVAAAAMGAQIIEKHFTLDRTTPGPDHPFAIEPRELAELIRQIRDVEAAMGSGQKHGPAEEEREFYNIARRSLHAAQFIPKGAKITHPMLTSKRPGYGIKPKYLGQVTGRTALADIEADSWITWDMV